MLFGKADNAGAVMFSDARLLLLPVRSPNTAYVWLICPLLFERFERDIKRIGGTPGFSAEKMRVEDGKYLSCHAFGELALEEREFAREGQELPERTAVLAKLKKLIADGSAAARLEWQLAVISNNDFAWFAKQHRAAAPLAGFLTAAPTGHCSTKCPLLMPTAES
jgi:CRISPR-associated protein Cmr4